MKKSRAKDKKMAKSKIAGKYIQARIAIRYSIALVLIILGIVFQDMTLSLSLIAVGILYLVISLFRIMIEEQISDTRTIIASNRAFRFAFLIISVFSLLVLFLGYRRHLFKDVVIVGYFIAILVLSYLVHYLFASKISVQRES